MGVDKFKYLKKMHFFYKAIIKILFILSFFFIFACGDNGGSKTSKGHRDAIKYECESSTNEKVCGLEVMQNFLEEGHEFATFEELNKDQEKIAKIECIRAKKFGLISYNNCLEKLKESCLDGKCAQPVITPPETSIAKLEKSTVLIVIYEGKSKDNIVPVGGGSGIIVGKRLIATNCHVALISSEKPNRVLLVKNINKENFALAAIYKKEEKYDVCILKKESNEEFKLSMVPIKRCVRFDKLARGNYVRTIGTPQGLEGHSAEGTINYLGRAGESGLTVYGEYEIAEDTKIINHSAAIAGGSSGGPLFDKNGYLIGINTFGDEKFNFSISCDHIQDLLKN
jgi:S1-C subfamily serine protease|tara:strand:- start:2582 stop:3601 length:1020 start_codon:yes stop_codon:yes gene_type:complete